MSGASSDEVKIFQGVTNEVRLLATQKPDEVAHKCDGLELRWHRRLQRDVELHTSHIKEYQRPLLEFLNPDARWRPVGKLHEAALRIKAKKAELEAEADKILQRLDGLDAKSPDVFDRAGKVIGAQNADLDAMDSELRQLSNLEST